MKKLILVLTGILFFSGLILTVKAADDNEGFTRAYSCQYYMKGKDNDCVIKVGPHKIMSPNCPFLTPQKMNILITQSPKCVYTPIISNKTEKYTCTYKSGICTVTVTGKSNTIKCNPPTINVNRVMADFSDGECVKEKSAQ